MNARPAVAGNVQRTIGRTFIVVGIVLAGIALVAWREILLLLFAGIVLGTALQPICDFVARRSRLTETPAAMLVYATLLVLLLGLFVWLAPQFAQQVAALWEQLPLWYADLRLWLLESPRYTLERIGRLLPAEIPAVSLANISALGPDGEGGGPIGFLKQALWAVAGVVSIGMLAFYWTINREVSIRSLLHFAPEHRRDFYRELADTLLLKVGAYVRGQLILCAIVGALSLVAYWLIGLPYVLVLALVAGILEAIPVFGPTLGAVPALVVALTIGPEAAAMTLVAAMLIQTLENYLFVPKVMNKSVGIPAVVTLLSLIAFGALFGLLGAILAIPLAAIVQTLFERLVLQADFKEKPVEVSRDFSGVMRYQLLDLIHDVQRQQRAEDAEVDEETTAAFNELEAIAVALDDLIKHEGNSSSGEEEPALTPALARSV